MQEQEKKKKKHLFFVRQTLNSTQTIWVLVDSWEPQVQACWTWFCLLSLDK